MPGAPRTSGGRSPGPRPRPAPSPSRPRARRAPERPPGARRPPERPPGARRAAVGRAVVEASGLLTLAVVSVVAALGLVAEQLAGPGLWSHLVPFAATVLALGLAAAGALRGWFVLRPWLAARALWLPPLIGVALGSVALAAAVRPEFGAQVDSLRRLTGGPAEAHRLTLAHQVYAAYRRADLAGMERILERARVFEPTVHEAANTFGVDPEVLMGVASTESSFHPRDSHDGGRGLFQITTPPQQAVEQARSRLRVPALDPLNQRHNAFVAAATLRMYLAQMHGDPFLGLLAYNIGPRNGGLESIMRQYGARDFVTIQPYLQHLPRDYPIRVLSAALAYRLWRTEGRLPRYEEGENARRIQQLGIPLLTVDAS